MADDSDSSYDSDEDFLTLATKEDAAGGGSGAAVDREALVRKKLLENFYGKSAVTASTALAGGTLQDDDEDDDDDDDDESPIKPMSTGNDLDSPNFDAKAHTEALVFGSDIHTLLQTQEQLSLQVRTLDSTMQTMVYENYSRFIDATDAIRNVGVNVQANEAGLKRLTAGMAQVDDSSKAVEDALGDLRDQVAEKIRVKRLLTRLDTLLKLPQTLRSNMAAGKYRQATKSYLAASNILSKHSAGFESLKNIEADCHVILTDMKQELDKKLVHWSGENISLTTSFDEHTPDPPRTMTEIFECAGTLFMLIEKESDESNPEGIDSLKSMSTSAGMRLLDRLLDGHLIEVQESRFGDVLKTTSASGTSSLIPTDFLDAVLEGATLYSMTFGSSEQDGYLMQFVSEAFDSFLAHVRSVLLEETAQASMMVTTTTPTAEEPEEEGNPGAAAAYADIATALQLLVLSVQGVASALPEVGIRADFAAALVDRASELTESMVRRRVDQTFTDLRQAVVKDCLAPFCQRLVDERQHALEKNKPVLKHILPTASSTLSDCLQLLDDTIRSIVLGGENDGMESSKDDARNLKEAVSQGTRRFCKWLADAMEILAGGDAGHVVVEAPLVDTEETDADPESMVGRDIRTTHSSSTEMLDDDLNDLPHDEALLDLLDQAKGVLLQATGDEGGSSLMHSDLVLAIAELCRLAQGSVSESVEQTIATHLGGSKRKSRGIFPSDEIPTGSNRGPADDDDITKGFRMAASRVLVAYATNCGMEAATVLCSGLDDTAAMTDFPTSPRQVAWKSLRVAKTTAEDCSRVFGGSMRAAPFQFMEDDIPTSMLSPMLRRKSGLQLDVERMFKEKVDIYPHPSEAIDASRNSVLFLVFKVVFRALLEHSRLLDFSEAGFRQLKVDIEFLKHMVSHYVNENYNAASGGGLNACNALRSILEEVMEVVEEGCFDAACTIDELKPEARSVVRSFLESVEDSPEIASQFILEEDSDPS